MFRCDLCPPWCAQWREHALQNMFSCTNCRSLDCSLMMAARWVMNTGFSLLWGGVLRDGLLSSFSLEHCYLKTLVSLQVWHSKEKWHSWGVPKDLLSVLNTVFQLQMLKKRFAKSTSKFQRFCDVFFILKQEVQFNNFTNIQFLHKLIWSHINCNMGHMISDKALFHWHVTCHSVPNLGTTLSCHVSFSIGSTQCTSSAAWIIYFSWWAGLVWHTGLLTEMHSQPVIQKKLWLWPDISGREYCPCPLPIQV